VAPGARVTVAIENDPRTPCREPLSSTAEAPRQATADDAGRFSFDHVPPCRVRISVGPSLRPWPIRARWRGGAEAFGINTARRIMLAEGQTTDVLLEVRPP
jgi:hypothetical protein